jgi:hypothetical protein
MTQTHTTADGREVATQTKEGFETVGSVEEAREVLESLKHGETMLKTVTQGDSFLAGTCDVVRSYPHRGELQVQPPGVGRCTWEDVDTLAQNIHDKRLPIQLVEWEGRV